MHKPTVELTNGVTIKINKVSPLLIMEVRKRFPAPTPPMNEVDYGDGVKKLEPNPADPKHIQALQDYDALLEEKMRRLLILRGIDAEVDKQAVFELKSFYKEEYGTELPGTDQEIYYQYILIANEEDLQKVIDAVLSRSQPTEGAVAKAIESFQPAVPGS